MSASTSRARAAGVSASSFLDLQAELSKKGAEFKKARAAGTAPKTISASERKTEKKPTKWSKPNKGVASRAARDLREFEALSNRTVESTRAILEKKSAMYEKLKNGKTGGLNEKQYDALLVDFERKMEEGEDFSSDDDDMDESAHVPRRLDEEDEEDPIVEYKDEFGRTRTGRRSEIPRELAHPSTAEVDNDDDDEAYVIHNPQNYFPTYEPSAARVAEIQTSLDEALKNPGQHYDGTKDNREKGAGFYQFSADDEERQRQMEALKRARDETVVKRGEADGEGASGGVESAPSRPPLPERELTAGEKRKRDLEERRRALDAKRRKLALQRVTADSTGLQTTPPTKEASLTGTASRLDPMVVLERARPAPSVKVRQPAPSDLATDFLAGLEKEMQAR